MAVGPSKLRLLLAGMIVGLLSGCTTRPPLEATEVHLQRTFHSIGEPAAEGRQPRVKQALAIDLITGHATLTDNDGQKYPLQIEPKLLEQLRQGIADRSWQIGALRAKVLIESPVHYRLSVTVQDQVLTQQARWTTARQEKWPPIMSDLVAAFDRAHRVAHPLSRKVNLIE